MAHLTTKPPPFRKPLAVDLRGPILPSPPDTDSDFVLNPASTLHTVADMDPLATPQPRRTSSLSYHNTFLRENRDRLPSARQSKWLVVVVPSSAIVSHLSGPASRVSQGTLMPLLPTLYSQLTAIVREYSFPSTVGLSLYLHFVEHGVSITPRITDETWHTLWAHLLDARSPVVSIQQLPVCGRIELDIDIHKARWYDSWVTALRRRTADPLLSAAPSLSHARGDSKTTVLDDRMPEDHLDGVPPRPRHAPRRLSLLNGFDTGSIASSSVYRTALRDMPEADQKEDTQERDELHKHPDNDLASRVRTWRASSSVAPSPMAATGQISLDPAHMPNNIPLPSPTIELAADADELNLDDFHWSVSSQGPGDDYESIYTPAYWHHPPSVDLDRRLAGSVLLSPSTIATSWGPDDGSEYLDSPRSNRSRISSVDLARRNEGSLLLSPSTATSWGPDYLEDYVSGLSSPHGPLTPDIGHRAFDDVLRMPSSAELGHGTPKTARPHTLGHATFLGVSQLVFPYFLTHTMSSRLIWSSNIIEDVPKHVNVQLQKVYPMLDIYPAMYPNMEIYPGHVNISHSSVGPSTRLGVLYPTLDIYPAVYPNFEIYPGHVVEFTEPADLNIRPTSKYPVLDIYPVVYPHFEIYPGYVMEFREVHDLTVSLFSNYPTFNIYSTVYPHFEIYPGNPVGFYQAPQEHAVNKAHYPRFEIYTGHVVELPLSSESATNNATYPDFEIYFGHKIEFKSDTPTPIISPHLEIKSSVSRFVLSFQTSVDETAVQPEKSVLQVLDGPRSTDPLAIDLESSSSVVYPDIEIYSGHVNTFTRPFSLQTRLEARYPRLDVYPVLYPDFEIYPGHIVVCQKPVNLDMRLSSVYPNISLYDVVYPHFEIYPGHVVAFRKPEDLNIRLSSVYPHISLYDVMYPHFEIYPGNVVAFQKPENLDVRLSSVYPHVSPYDVVYPHFEIYPGDVITFQGPENHEVRLSSAYPYLNLYDAVYPHFEIYPGHVIAFQEPENREIRLSSAYPYLNLYDVVYPHFEIYPGHVIGFQEHGNFDIKLGTFYPHFSIYEAVYPHFEIYPGHVMEFQVVEEPYTQLASTYPSIVLYQVVYPHFEIYPGHIVACESIGLDKVVAEKRTRSTHAQLHADVFPVQKELVSWAAFIRPRRTHAQLHAEVFALIEPPSPTLISDQLSPFQWAAVSAPDFNANTQDLRTASRFMHQLSASQPIPQVAPINTRVAPSPGPATSQSGHTSRHRRTESTESTESIDSQTGLPRRKDPPPVAMRAPIMARRRSSTTSHVVPLAPPDVTETEVTIDEEPSHQTSVTHRRLPDVVNKNGLPINPASSLRRSASSAGSVSTSAHKYPAKLSPVEERPPVALQRSTSLSLRHERKLSSEAVMTAASRHERKLSSEAVTTAALRHDRSLSAESVTKPHSSPLARKPPSEPIFTAPARHERNIPTDSATKLRSSRRSARDSVVLEKVKLFGQSHSPDDSTRPVLRGQNEVSSHFIPPVPPLPSSTSSRLVSKLDKSKYPFS